MKFDRLELYYNFFTNWHKPILKDFIYSYLNFFWYLKVFSVTFFANSTWFENTGKYAHFETIYSFFFINNKNHQLRAY